MMGYISSGRANKRTNIVVDIRDGGIDNIDESLQQAPS